jgi:hypothetical protein
LSYQLVVECIIYYGNPSHERIKFVEEYLKELLGNIDKVQVFESEISQNIIIPQVLIYYKDEDSVSFIRKVDSALTRIGLTTTRAIVLKVTTHAAEGAALGGLAGVATSKKKDILLYGMIGILFGTAIGGLLKKGTPILAAVKESGKWSIQRL